MAEQGMTEHRVLVAREGINENLGGVEFLPESMAHLDGEMIFGPGDGATGEVDMSAAWYKVVLEYDRRGARANPKTGSLWAKSYGPLMNLVSPLNPERTETVADERAAVAVIFRTKSWAFVPVWQVERNEEGQVIKADILTLNIRVAQKSLIAAQHLREVEEKATAGDDRVADLFARRRG